MAELLGIIGLTLIYICWELTCEAIYQRLGPPNMPFLRDVIGKFISSVKMRSLGLVKTFKPDQQSQGDDLVNPPMDMVNRLEQVKAEKQDLIEQLSVEKQKFSALAHDLYPDHEVYNLSDTDVELLEQELQRELKVLSAVKQKRYDIIKRLLTLKYPGCSVIPFSENVESDMNDIYWQPELLLDKPECQLTYNTTDIKSYSVKSKRRRRRKRKTAMLNAGLDTTSSKTEGNERIKGQLPVALPSLPESGGDQGQGIETGECATQFKISNVTIEKGVPITHHANEYMGELHQGASGKYLHRPRVPQYTEPELVVPISWVRGVMWHSC